MKILCVDDDRQVLQRHIALCRELPHVTQAEGFSGAQEALAWAEEHSVDLALLDIAMPGLDGLSLARALREKQPHMAIIFLTAHKEYAVEAWEMHATSYVLKPLTRERLIDELSYATEWRRKQAEEDVIAHIAVQTFGNFDLLVDGNKVNFSRAKAKELFACLVDKKGIWISRKDVFCLLWEGEEYTRPRQKVLDVVIRSLRETLRENEIGEILQLERDMLRIVPQALDCDAYRLLAGDPTYENRYRGEYMSLYSWARPTEGAIDSELRRRRLLRQREKTV